MLSQGGGEGPQGGSRRRLCAVIYCNYGGKSPLSRNTACQATAQTCTHLGRVHVRGGVVVGVAQQRLDGRQDHGHRVDGLPLVLDDVQAQGAVGEDCGVRAGGGGSNGLSCRYASWASSDGAFSTQKTPQTTLQAQYCRSLYAMSSTTAQAAHRWPKMSRDTWLRIGRPTHCSGGTSL